MTPDPHRGSKRLRESGAVDLAEELAANLNRVVPEDVALAALPGGTIRIMAGEGGGWREVSRWPQEAPASVALNVLYALQDEIIENSTHTGWPPVDPSRPELAKRGSELPYPAAEVVDEALLLWYGDPDNLALALPPITVGAEYPRLGQCSGPLSRDSVSR
jgi:hypothetical protein